MIIGHYDHEIWMKGGLATYIRRVSKAQQAAGHQVYYFSKRPCVGLNPVETPIVVADNVALFEKAQQLGLDILHLHRSVTVAPPDDLPVVRTLHGHQPYCPSGSQFLATWNHPCDRTYSPMGCLWGHFVDRCGSIRPLNFQASFQETWHEIATLPQIPTLTVSHFLRNQMIQAGYPADLIQVLYLFAPDIADTAPSPEKGIPHFLFLGRITPLKGLSWLLQALKEVTVPVHLDIAGEGYQQTEMSRLANQLHLTEKVTFHGWVNSEQANQLIHNARALVFPSIWHEPGGTVAFEAMAHARPVIMSRVGGMPEVVHEGVNGVLANPSNISELAKCIEQLGTDYSLAQQLGNTGRQIAIERFSLQKHMSQLMQIYTTTCSQKITRKQHRVQTS